MLAAGASSRFGSPKQLASFAGEPLVVRAARTALAAGIGPVVVVTGFEAVRVKETLAAVPVAVVHNEAWRDGMASSIRAAVAHARATGSRGLLLTSCDQPLVSAPTLERLARAADAAEGLGLAAALYADAPGIPAFFGFAWFDALEALSGDRGARSLLSAADRLVLVPCPEAAADVDTTHDLEQIPLHGPVASTPQGPWPAAT